MPCTSINNPYISIVMPAYNCGRYIGDAIKSVINQTYLEWELIIIDDGSKDDTAVIAYDFTLKDNRIRFYKNNENIGVSATRNKAVVHAQGEWIAFLDSDDMWDCLKLEKQITLTEKGYQFIYSGSAFINEKGEYYQGIFKVPEKVNYKKLRLHNVIPCSSVLIKKTLLENVKMERDDIHEDYAAWLKILKSGISAYGVNEPLLIYRISRSSKSGNKFKSIKMTYNVFRYLSCNKLSSIYFLCRHLTGSIFKYAKIRKCKNPVVKYEA